MQFVHNHTVLHDRTAFEDWPEPETQASSAAAVARGARRASPAAGLRRTLRQRRVGNRGGIICKGTRLHAPLEAV